MSDESQHENSLDQLADEFVARYRRGERPAVSEYCELHPELAADIRRIFPTLVVMEQARPDGVDSQAASSAYDAKECAAALQSKRLGDYRILREIARGGMGIVYEAEQESLKRHVALKVLPPQAVLDPRHLQRFQREARAAARLHHTNIVPVFGVGEHEGVHYYVMQFIPGLGLDQVLKELRRLRRKPGNKPATASTHPELSDASGTRAEFEPGDSVSVQDIAESLMSGKVRQEGAGISANSATAIVVARSAPEETARPTELAFRVSAPTSDGSESGLHGLGADTTSLSQPGSQYWQSVARIGVQVADALEYAAGQGVLHRDVKPSNLLLDTRGTVWVTDFGLAKATDHDNLTHPGDIVGTLRYLAPERLKGQVDLRGDLYSLGVTLYEMLALRPPFQDHDRARLVRRILDDEPARPRSMEPAIPIDLETIVLKAIAKDPSDRYQTARALAADLRQFLEDKPIAARRAGTAERLWRWGRRNPIVAGLTAAVAVLLISAIVILSISNSMIRQESAARKEALTDKEIALGAKTAALESLAVSESLARHRFYAAQMNLAGHAFERGELARVLDLLESQRPYGSEPDLRGFEWYYFWREIHRTLHLAFRQGNDELWCLEFSPDGKSLAVGGKSGDVGSLKLWEVETGKLVAELLEKGQDVVSSVAFSPDGRFLVSGSADDALRIWDTARHRLVVPRIETGVGVRTVRWSRQGNRIAAGCQDGSVRIYDGESFAYKGTLPPMASPVLGLSFSPDGMRLFAAIAWGSAKKGLTRIYDLTTDPPQLQTPEFAGRFVTDTTPDGSSVASYEDGKLRVWDPVSGVDRIQIVTNAGWLSSVRFSSDSRRIAIAGFDDRLATVWDCDSKEALVRGPHAQAVQVVAIDPNRRFWASGSIDGEVKIWHYDTASDAAVVGRIRGTGRIFVSSPRGELIIGGNRVVQAYDLQTGEAQPMPEWRHVRAVSADGAVFAIAVPGAESAAPETLEIWDRSTGECRQSWRLPDATRLYYENIVLSRTGRLLATRSWEMPLRVWDVSGNEPKQLPDFGRVESMSLAFSPDERLLVAACQFGRVRIWDLEKGTELPELQKYESGSGWALSVCFSSDGGRLAVGNSFGVVRVWDTRTLQLKSILKGHLGDIPDLVFLPDGRRLAVASVGSVRLWDVEVGQELASLATQQDDAKFLVVTPDGRNLVSMHKSGWVRLWKSARPIMP
jgi:WD40 repeat protein/serine/threonine protein kinase